MQPYILHLLKAHSIIALLMGIQEKKPTSKPKVVFKLESIIIWSQQKDFQIPSKTGFKKKNILFCTYRSHICRANPPFIFGNRVFDSFQYDIMICWKEIVAASSRVMELKRQVNALGT